MNIFRSYVLWTILTFLSIRSCRGLNSDGVLLLSLKHSVLSDPLKVLESWRDTDATPCAWVGVTCESSRATGLSLRSSLLLGSIPADLGRVEKLQRLDLSNNSINGSIPATIFDSRELRVLDLSNNLISGELPASIGQLQGLRFLDLSDNALSGKLPGNLWDLRRLKTASLKNNYFSGELSGGLRSVRVLDLSSNLINGSLPVDFSGESLRYFNVSYNRLSGEIPPEFGRKIPVNATVDLSFNDLAGEVPDSEVFRNQKTTSFQGNPNLCGSPVKKPCAVSASPTSTPAIAAIPKIDSDQTQKEKSKPNSTEKQSRLRAGAIVGIVIGDLAGISVLAVIFIYAYKFWRKRNAEGSPEKEVAAWSCLRNVAGAGESSSGSEEQSAALKGGQYSQRRRENIDQADKVGTLVTVDGEEELELEALLRASAYILGAAGSSIVYKAVLEDGTALAVRRIGETGGADRLRSFEGQVRAIARLSHPNLVRVRGFYWGPDEKLVVYDYVPNGSLANARYRKVGSSPCHMPWEVRLKIAKGVARGLLYFHDKKHVHGNLKPSNILLGSDMEPKIGDFGLERLVYGDTSYKAGTSARNFGSNRSTESRESFQDHGPIPTPSPSPSTSMSRLGCLTPYQAPESLRSLRPSPKWDVYAFGVILLELLTGKVVVLDELGQGLGVDDKARALRMADMAIRAELEGKEELLVACFKLGYSCASQVPQKRPQMREVVQVLDKIPSSPFSTSPYYCAQY